MTMQQRQVQANWAFVGIVGLVWLWLDNHGGWELVGAVVYNVLYNIISFPLTALRNRGGQ